MKSYNQVCLVVDILHYAVDGRLVVPALEV